MGRLALILAKPLHAGHAEIWFYQGLGGLDIDFSRQTGAISLAPQAVDGIVDQAASYNSTFGRIACRLRRDGRRLRLTAEIPPGQSATITLPRTNPAAVREGPSVLANAKGVSAIKQSGSATLLTVQSGTYTFSWTSE